MMMSLVDLIAERDALKQELDDLKAATRVGHDPYAIVLVDAHTHKVHSRDQYKANTPDHIY